VPHFIFEVNSIPYNVNGKKMEVQTKAVLNGGQRALLDISLPESGRAALEPFIQYFHVEQTMEKPESQDVCIKDSKL
jgi:acetoacetyl-CoA synthetase